MKPIRDWTDTELKWAGPEHSEDLAAEVLRLRTESASRKAQVTEYGKALEIRARQIRQLELDAEAAEAALADARDTVIYERRANEDNCAKLLEAEAELAQLKSVVNASRETDR